MCDYSKYIMINFIKEKVGLYLGLVACIYILVVTKWPVIRCISSGLLVNGSQSTTVKVYWVTVMLDWCFDHNYSIWSKSTKDWIRLTYMCHRSYSSTLIEADQRPHPPTPLPSSQHLSMMTCYGEIRGDLTGSDS